MKKLLLISLMGSLAIFSGSTWPADKPANQGKTAVSSTEAVAPIFIRQDTPMNLRQTAAAIRSGTINVGKEYSLNPENGRFHRVHASVLGINDEPVLDIRCGGCHSTDYYPDSYLYLRKFEFPRMVDGEKVRPVQRHFCIGCHSGGSVSTVFYNPK
ncbi:MAG: hypothetical protein GC183_12610 [Thiobacillus sp.]|nr:hypothetical protein [Thiobacillus sp.]